MVDTCSAMKIRRGQSIIEFETDLSEFGFEHLRYFKDGVRQLVDDAGNAVFVTRGELIVSMYSHDAGTAVAELEIKKSTKERSWPLFDIAAMSAEFAEEEADQSRRLSELKDPWDKLIASLPPLSEGPSELVQAVREARHELEMCCVWLEDSIADGEDCLGDAHDAINSITELAPKANVSSLLMLIVIAGQRLHKR